MIRFDSDYCEGGHPRVLDKLIATNLEQTATYGEDDYCQKAAELLRKECRTPDADIHFLVGGTQTNLILISSALRPHQGILSACTGHIFVHETGAVEATGHKVIALPSDDGKITMDQVCKAYEEHVNDRNHEHMVQPGLVYLSHPSENGTLYNKSELLTISKYCRENGLFLYLDGARLGYALCAAGNDLELHDIAKCCDAFYIGGTKMGALFGEALVITNPLLKKDFRYHIKQKGALLAKGRLLGLQFIALFEDGLYYDIGKRANAQADRIRKACEKKGYPFLCKTNTNQQFPVIPDAILEEIGKKYHCSFWQRIDANHSAVRFCTSWATKDEDVDALVLEITGDCVLE